MLALFGALGLALGCLGLAGLLALFGALRLALGCLGLTGLLSLFGALRLGFLSWCLSRCARLAGLGLTGAGSALLRGALG